MLLFQDPIEWYRIGPPPTPEQAEMMRKLIDEMHELGKKRDIKVLMAKEFRRERYEPEQG